MAPLFQALGLPAALLLTACSQGAPLAQLECSAIAVMADARALEGIEDMAQITPNVLVLSAYNRRAHAASPNGLFALRLDQSGKTWSAVTLEGQAETLLPHGLVYDTRSEQLSVIDRSQSPAHIITFNVDEEHRLSAMRTLLSPQMWTEDAPYPCNLNDLAASDDGALIFTNDRQACSGLGLAFTNVFGLETGSVWSIGQTGAITVLADNLYFPNGVASGPKDDIWVSLTRAKQAISLGTDTAYTLPGAPDNLSIDPDSSTLWAALIPSLPEYALYRQGALGSAGPSRIAAIKDEGGDTIEIFETSSFTGATTALRVGDYLYLSGAFSPGIARCKVPNA